MNWLTLWQTSWHMWQNKRLTAWHWKVKSLRWRLSVFSVSAAYIKVYLLENGICVAKKKTKAVRKSLDPLYNQVLVFSESSQGKVVQVRCFQVWNSPNGVNLAIRSFSIREPLFSFWTCHLLTMSSSSVYHLWAAMACTDILSRWWSSGKKKLLLWRIRFPCNTYAIMLWLKMHLLLLLAIVICRCLIIFNRLVSAKLLYNSKRWLSQTSHFSELPGCTAIMEVFQCTHYNEQHVEFACLGQF